MQYSVIFNCDMFLIFAQNIDHGYTVLTSTHDLCFRAKMRKMYTPVNPSFTPKFSLDSANITESQDSIREISVVPFPAEADMFLLSFK